MGSSSLIVPVCLGVRDKSEWYCERLIVFIIAMLSIRSNIVIERFDRELLPY